VAIATAAATDLRHSPGTLSRAHRIADDSTPLDGVNRSADDADRSVRRRQVKRSGAKAPGRHRGVVQPKKSHSALTMAGAIGGWVIPSME